MSGYFPDCEEGCRGPGAREQGGPSHQVTLMEVWVEEGRALLALAGVGEALQRPWGCQ